MNNADIVGNSNYIGGIAGISYLQIKNCYNTGSVTTSGTGNIGGIVGNSASVSTQNVYTIGDGVQMYYKVVVILILT